MFAKELLLTCFLVGYGDFVSQACYKDRANLFQDTANSNDSKYQQRALRKSSTNTIEKTIKHKGEANKAFVFDQVFYQSSEEFGDTGRNCGTQDLPLSEQQKTQQEVDEFLLENFGESGARRLQEIQQITVNTYIHIVYRNNSTDPTNVPDAIVNKQMAVLNDAFSGRSLDYSDCNNNPPTGFATPFRFKLAAVTRTLNDTWHYSWQNSTMAGVLRQGNCSDLNIFIHTPKYGKLGLSSFPSDCNDQNLLKDYVSLHWQTLPDSSWSPFNEGDTLVHEIGHWLGLFHTFEGGCSYIGDSVQDTPREKRPARGCPIGLDTCGSAGLDPVTNYMDYTDDCCMFTFTSGQVSRMVGNSIYYRNMTYTNITVPVTTPAPTPLSLSQKNDTAPVSCPTGQLLAEVNLKTDTKPEETSWDIVDATTKMAVFSFQADAQQQVATINTSVCLDESKLYFLIINDAGGNGMRSLVQGYWRLSINGSIKSSGSTFQYHDGYYGIGSWPSCTNENTELMSLLLQTDNNGNQTSWTIQNNTTRKVLFANTVQLRNNALYAYHRCVPVGSILVFTIYDSGKNGLCCNHGHGFFAMFYNGTEVLKGERFAASRSVTLAT